MPRFDFVPLLSFETPQPDKVFLAVGGQVCPGVIDHRHAGPARVGACSSTLLLEEPQLVEEHLGETPLEDLEIATCFDPEMDGALACYLVMRWKRDGAFPAGARELAEYVRRVIHGDFGAHEDLAHAPFAVYEVLKRTTARESNARAKRVEKEKLDRAFELFEQLLRAASRGVEVTSREAFQGASDALCAALESVRQDREAFQRDLARTKWLRHDLLAADRSGDLRSVTGIAIEKPASLLLPVWAYAERSDACPGGIALVLATSEGAPNITISVDPKAGVRLFGLADLLERKETQARARSDCRPNGPNRLGYDSPDPWFDGRGMAYESSIVAAPWHGTVLGFAEVVAALDAYQEQCRGDAAGLSSTIRGFENLEGLVGSERWTNLEILRRLFFDERGKLCARGAITVQKEYSEGQSGARVFPVFFTKASGAASVTVVKTGRAADIEAEHERWRRLERAVAPANFMTPIVASARVGDLAGLVYLDAASFAASNTHAVESFGRLVSRTVGDDPEGYEEACALAGRLLERMRAHGFHRPSVGDDRTSAFFDLRLVPNAELSDAEVAIGAPPTLALHDLYERSQRSESPPSTVELTLGGLHLHSIEGSDTLRCRDGRGRGKYDLRFSRPVRDIAELAELTTGAPLPPVRGRLISTRAARLASLANDACGATDADRRALLRRHGLPDPIDGVHDLLTGGGAFQPIAFAHGDLNTGNIVVTTSTDRSHELSPMLIDWASFSDDLPLAFDFVKLEIELRTQVLPSVLAPEADDEWLAVETSLAAALAAGKPGPERIDLASQSPARRVGRLVALIRRSAFACVGPADALSFGSDYLRTAILYALASLKFALPPRRGKRLAYLSAAVNAERYSSMLARSGPTPDQDRGPRS